MALVKTSTFTAGAGKAPAVKRAVPPVAQLTRGTLPCPQLDQRVRPQVQVERRHVRPVVA